MKSKGYWGLKENQGTMRQMDLCGHNMPQDDKFICNHYD